MKKKVLKGWVIIRKRGGLTLPNGDLVLFLFKKQEDAEYYSRRDEEKVIKGKVTIEPL